MPLMKPVIEDPTAEILRDSGFLSAQGAKSDGDRLKEILENKGLGLDKVVAELADLVNYSREETIRLRAIDTSLKLHRVMEPEGAAAPSVTIVIQSSLQQGGVPQILLPRTATQIEA